MTAKSLKIEIDFKIQEEIIRQAHKYILNLPIKTPNTTLIKISSLKLLVCPLETLQAARNYLITLNFRARERCRNNSHKTMPLWLRNVSSKGQGAR